MHILIISNSVGQPWISRHKIPAAKFWRCSPKRSSIVVKQSEFDFVLVSEPWVTVWHKGELATFLSPLRVAAGKEVKILLYRDGLESATPEIVDQTNLPEGVDCVYQGALSAELWLEIQQRVGWVGPGS